MKVEETIAGFSVFGGPLHQIGTRLGLIRKNNNSLMLGFVFGYGVWIILFLLALVNGRTENFFSMSLLAGHVRFLVAIPLFFVCESLMTSKMSTFVGYLVESGLVPEKEVPKLSEVIKKVNRLKNSWIPETVLVLIVYIVPLIGSANIIPGKSSNTSFILQQAGDHYYFSSQFYIWVGLPLFRFLLGRWFWHLALWWFFLFRIQKLDLNLIPTHSDGVAGLGFLEIVQEYFAALALAFSAILSASFAEQVISGSQPFEKLYYQIPMAMAFILLVLVAPLAMFYSKLKNCRELGFRDYMIMATNYVNAFDRKWVKTKPETKDSILGTPDIQSLADLKNSVLVIQQMRLIPISRKLVTLITISVLLPFVPFVFMKFNLNELVILILKQLAGK
jgi:hypothetical protein